MWYERAELVVEVLPSRGDAPEKLPFYARHGVEEIVTVDPAERRLRWLALSDGACEPIERGTLIELRPSELAARIEWPAAG